MLWPLMDLVINEKRLRLKEMRALNLDHFKALYQNFQPPEQSDHPAAQVRPSIGPLHIFSLPPTWFLLGSSIMQTISLRDPMSLACMLLQHVMRLTGSPHVSIMNSD